MTTVTPIVHEGDSLRIVVTVNGRTRSSAVVKWLHADDGLPPLAADDFNINKASECEAFLARLDPALRPEVTTLLLKAAESVMEYRARKPRAKSETESTDDDRPPQFSDDACAMAFTRTAGADYRFTAGLGKWHRFTGTRWEPDETYDVFDRIRLSNRKMAASSAEPRVATIVAAGRTVAAVERLAHADRVHATTVDQWDRDPMVLNTPGGLVDLATGRIRRHRREDYCTKITAVAPGGSCPQWLEFLKWTTGNDEHLIGFLRRMAGYCLTASIIEHALFFLYGFGGNGKSTFLRQLFGILADYAVDAAVDTFTASFGERHTTELARLRGARLVTAQETEEGRQWAEARIKSVTGGEPVTARFMRQDDFTFFPTFKLIIAGNHRPALRTVDEAIRRRFHLLPFTQTITDEKKDPTLGDKLKTEWPGILAWMIDGCLEWQRLGLAPPDAVRNATKEYLEAEDSFTAWLGECCVRDKQQTSVKHWTSVADLFGSWEWWAKRAGELAGTAKAFSEAMQRQGFERATNARKTQRGFSGVSLVIPDPPADHYDRSQE